MSAQHTPSLIFGPWQLNEQDDYYAVHASDPDAPIMGNLVCKLPLGPQGEERGRLIAAAPDLMEALQGAMEALAMCQPRTDHGAACQQVAMLAGRAALAKARGEA